MNHMHHTDTPHPLPVSPHRDGLSRHGQWRGLAIGVMLMGFGLSQAARAEEKEMGPYFTFDGGANWVQSVSATSGGFSGTADLDVGGRFGMAVGYNFHPNVGAEFETGWLWNNFRDSDFSLTQVPFLVNGVFRLPNRTGFEPYVGAGVGGMLGYFGINDCCGDFDNDFVFAWQGKAGVTYRFHPNMAVGLGYKYLGTAETDYNVFGIHTHLNTLHNHSVSVVFNMKF